MLRLENLVKSFVGPDGSRHTVVDVPEFDFPEQGTLCLVGRSGSGKTTLLNLVSGIVTPTSGSVLFGDRSIGTLSEPERDHFRARSVGFVFQTFNLLGGLSAQRNVALAASLAGRSRGEARSAATALLKRVGLEARADARPATMSTGEQQRVAVARAVVNRPKVILADEPTANLDEENGQAVLQLLDEVSAEVGALLVIVTHEREVMERYERCVSLKEISR